MEEMTNEKAISSLQMLRDLMLFDPMSGEEIPYSCLNQDNKDLYNAAGVAIEALEKQIEKQVKNIKLVGTAGNEVFKSGDCPCCNHSVVAGFVAKKPKQEDRCCGSCGQALNWEED